MHDALAPHAREAGATVALVDIDADPALATRYGHRIPVLAAPDDEVICQYVLDVPRVRRYLRLP